MKVIINQVFRTLLHSRLKLGLQRYIADDRFQGDIVLLEPRERDANFFALNPMAFWKRSEAVRHGFESVRTTIEHNYDELRRSSESTASPSIARPPGAGRSAPVDPRLERRVEPDDPRTSASSASWGPEPPRSIPQLRSWSNFDSWDAGIEPP